jgi:hypothetical protein
MGHVISAGNPSVNMAQTMVPKSNTAPLLHYRL